MSRRKGVYFHEGCLLGLIVGSNSTGEFVTESAALLQPPDPHVAILPDVCDACSRKYQPIQARYMQVFSELEERQGMSAND